LSENGTSNYPFINQSNSPWLEDNKTYASSQFALRSGSIPDYSTSEFSVNFETSGADTLSFAYLVSSEAGYDFLQFYVDSVLQQSWSGEKGWDRYNCALEPGFHEVVWSYHKDQSMSRGMDAAWIDDIVFPESAFRQSDLSIMEILQPASSPWLTSEELVCLRVRNTGMDTIPEFFITMTLDQQSISVDSISVLLFPGGEVEITLPTSLDLSGTGLHLLHISMSSGSDNYPGNNQLAIEVERYSYPDLALSLIQLEELDGIQSDAILDIENAGNTMLDSLRFELWFAGSMSGSGSRYIGLETGQVVRDTFRLVDSLDNDLTTGLYDYLIRSKDEDSNPANNEVSGVLYWHALGIKTSDPPNVMLYPNPARKGLHLILPYPVEKLLMVELININGRVAAIHGIETGATHLYVPVSSLTPGNYLMKIPEFNISLPVVITE